MNTEELRAIIWDGLFRSKQTVSIDDIAAQLHEDPTAVRAAVEHDWFKIRDGHVSIAMAAPGSPLNSRQQSRDIHHG
jgi:hypothetical protein